MSLPDAVASGLLTAFEHYLAQLFQFVSHLEALSSERGTFGDILSVRLAPDMFDCGQQIRTAAGFALRAWQPFCDGVLVPPEVSETVVTFEGLRHCVHRSQQGLERVPATWVASWWRLAHTTQAGCHDIEFDSGDAFVQRYALPNFLFHFSMAYAIARQQGYPVSKRHFDGYHHYPAGFSFV